MNKPYIYGHRGASGYAIENTILSFRKAAEMNVGIETDIQITKDNKLICFHDPSFKVKDRTYQVKNLSLEKIRSFKFNDERDIPTINEVFDTFNHCPKEFRYSCDIANKETGLLLINLINEYSYFNRVEITDMRLRVLIKLRQFNKKIKLDYTIPPNTIKVSNKTINFDKLLENDIQVLNVNINFINMDNFSAILNQGLQCYVWGVNTKIQMKKVLNLNKNGEFVRAIYTDYPDILKGLRDKYFS